MPCFLSLSFIICSLKFKTKRIDNASAIDSFTNLVLASLVFGSCEQINCGLMASFLLTLTQDMAIREALVKAERQLKLSKRKYWYKIPGISKTTSSTDIKRAYKWLALQWHPDKNVENHEEAENMFREIAAAYEVLFLFRVMTDE